MKKNRECKIIQDLFPNYIEGLTSEETNNFILEHINTCGECNSILDSMKREVKLETLNADKEEIKYLKKYSKKLKFLRNILLIILTVFIVTIVRRFIILSHISKVSSEIQNINNYHSIIKTCNREGVMGITETFRKDNDVLSDRYYYSNDSKSITHTGIFNKGNEYLTFFAENDSRKTVEYKDTPDDVLYYSSRVLPIEGNSISLIDLKAAFTCTIHKVKLYNLDCYLIKWEDCEYFVDVNTCMTVKIVDYANNRTTDYYCEFNTVTDEDIQKPDFTGFTIYE